MPKRNSDSNSNKNRKNNDQSAWAIKIGGSLYTSKYLALWLQSISELSNKKIIIVPGGGPFADQVRQADKKFKLNEVYSHHMAVMAMQQFGNVLASLSCEMVLANSKQKIHQSWAEQKVVIWEPYEMVRDQCILDKTWEVTSDSLALWISNILDIENLLFVKSSKQVLNDSDIKNLAKKGCIDPTVQELTEKYHIDIKFLHDSQVTELATLFSSA